MKYFSLELEHGYLFHKQLGLLTKNATSMTTVEHISDFNKSSALQKFTASAFFLSVAHEKYVLKIFSAEKVGTQT